MAILRFHLERVTSVLGAILMVTDDQERIRMLDFEDDKERMNHLLRIHYGLVDVLQIDGRSPSSPRRSLEAYFSGEITAIDKLGVETAGTPFQREVWAALRMIPAGMTISYGELAAGIGRPKAVRAVGLANGSNPVAIVVPCHRVIGTDGSLTGYGGGLERKRWLLAHEGAELSLKHPT
ncbi:MAG: methylated-DNA--[protein]-cysteine S-methyltransferase [Candidatus Binataceae bacterium]